MLKAVSTEAWAAICMVQFYDGIAGIDEVPSFKIGMHLRSPGTILLVNIMLWGHELSDN